MTKFNNKLVQRVVCLLVLMVIVAGGLFEASAQRRRRGRRVRRVITRTVTPQPAPIQYYTVAADTVIRVRLNDELNSGTARVGDRFSANVTEPVHAGGGVEVVPVGSKVWGRVTTVSRAQRRKPGNITVAFNSVELPNGRTAVVNGSLTTLQADDVNADNEGTVKGTSNRKRDAVFVGGGAATGAIIGAIAGGGKGAAIGGILGGALGTGARVLENEKEAEVKSGTEFGVILNRAVSLPASRVQ